MAISENKKLPISVQICTLNEEGNISDCIKNVLKNDPAEIIVIDGGSEDRTVEIALGMGVNVINAGRIGLANQRQMGIISTELPYLAIVDADDRIANDCLHKLYEELNFNRFTAIQACVQSYSNKTYWQKGWGIFCSVNINNVGKTTMVGRPALYNTEKITKIGFDPFFTYGCEDTDLSYRFEKAGYAQGIGTGVSKRIHPAYYKECRRKWISYGRGYSRFVSKYPEKKERIAHHIFINIPFIRTWNIIRNGYIKYCFFNFLYSFFVIVGYYRENRSLNKGKISFDFGR